MNELEMHRMKRDASDAAFGGFGGMIFSVADHGMSDGGKLYANLILQSCGQRDSEQGCGSKATFNDEAKFGTGGLRVACGS